MRKRKSSSTYFRDYYRRNKEKLDDRAQKWRKAHPDAVKVYAARHRRRNRIELNRKAREKRRLFGAEINKKTQEYRQATIKTFLSKKYSQLKKEKHRGKKNDKYKLHLTLYFLLRLWAKQKGLCAISRKKMEHKFGTPFTASIDRIDSNIGYFEGNVQLVCQAINFAKNKYSNADFLYFWRHDKLPY